MSFDNVQITLFGVTTPLATVVARYELAAGIGELTELTMELFLTDPEIDMAAFVGRPALVNFTDDPVFPQLDGIVRSTRQLSSEPTGISRYEISIVPPLWLTTLRTDHRIFQDLSVPEIVETILRFYTDRVPPPGKALKNEHAPREYCVQYGETDWDFIHRILADEGIGSFFEPLPLGQSPATQWTLTDDTTLGKPVITVPFIPPSGQVTTQHHVHSVEVSAEMKTTLVSARDYDYKKPEFILERTAVTRDPVFKDEGEIEAYTFEIGRFNDERGGDLRTTQLLEEARAMRRTLRLGATFTAAPGTVIAVTGLPGHDMEQNLLVVRARSIGVSGQGSAAPTIQNLLECVPLVHPHRPRRRPKPRIYGTQTAFVVGDEGKEIDTDELGRVKVEFRWDRRDLHEGRPTRRVRASQGWAGFDSGFVMLPRVNDEVIVAYLDGDPDEPIIVGRVHNGFVTTPLKLPDEQTQSIWKSRSSPGGEGFNMIRMEDQAGSEMLEMRAQKDFRRETLRDENRVVGNNETVAVTGAQSVTAGSHSTSAGTIAFSANTTLKGHAGTEMSLDAGSQFSAKSVTCLVNGTVVTSVHGGSMLYLHGGVSTYLSGGVTAEITGGSSATVKAPTIFLDGGTVYLTGSGEVHINSAAIKVVGGTVDVSGSTINISGGTVNITGGSVNLNG